MSVRPDLNLSAGRMLADPETRRRVDRAIIELRRRRVPYRAIGEALGVFEGLRMTEPQVRYRARHKLGLPADEFKKRRRTTAAEDAR